jgi:hypothetical protein
MKVFDNMLKDEKRIIFLSIVYQITLILFYADYFGQYFPNRNAALGHDYAYFFPHLLDGYYWFVENGILQVPWFSPAFCGGVPAFPNPQNMFYSIPQFLTFAVGPLFGVYISVIIFAWLGYIGTYLLVHRIFNVNRISSSLAATLFLMNGFFFSRMIIGHLAFHAFMLLPLLCFILLKQDKGQTTKTLGLVSSGYYSILSGLILTYMIYSGMMVIIVPVILTVIAVACIYGLRGGQLGLFWKKIMLAAIVSLAICSAKLISSVSFINQFPRNQYQLPGSSFFESVELFFRSLFLPGGWSFAASLISHFQFQTEMNEYDYNITPLPLIIIVIGICLLIKQKSNILQRFSISQWLYSSVLIAILIIPFLLNLYSPGWHEFLKTLPVIKTSSSLFRWYIIYILPILIVMALFIEHISMFNKYKLLIFSAGIAIVLIFSVTQPMGFYQYQKYKPDDIINAYNKHKAKKYHPKIDKISVFTDSQGSRYGNDAIMMGASQISCYEPIFGYQLEELPIKTLHPGLITIQENGFFNLKNPACYLYPEENNCHPGDHFIVGQEKEMMKFAAYNGYKFNVPLKQTVASWISMITFIFCIAYILIYCGSITVVALHIPLSHP